METHRKARRATAAEGIVLRIVAFLLAATALHVQTFAADERSIGVFVSLCDNVHQGIVRVPKAIGNGDDPDRNLYWGCDEGFMGVFAKCAQWKGESVPPKDISRVMRAYTCRNANDNVVLTAFAYRGSEIRSCLEDFEKAIANGTYDLLAYIGHNGLMDFSLPTPVVEKSRKKAPECVVLCCKSQQHFQNRIEAMQAKPILLTTQFMYPGAFVLRDVLDEWISRKGLKACRVAAGRAYAANQKISLKAALGVFADIERQTAASTEDIDASGSARMSK